MKKYLDIVITADKNYAKVIGVLMFSILQNLQKDITARFHIFSYKFSPNDIKELEKLKKIYPCEIINTRMEDYIDIFRFAKEDKFRNRWITIACYFRLLIFKILPDYVEKCFYIDSDMIVNCNLEKIKLPQEKMFLACIEPLAMQKREDFLSHCYKIEEFKNFRLEPEKYPYFNAGFFLVDIKKSKQNGIWEQILEILHKYPELPYCDQDVLNIIFGQKYSDLTELVSNEYNVFTNIDYNMPWDKVPVDTEVLRKCFYNPKIYHYAGAAKPWNSTNVINWNEVWWEYCKKTPWKNIFFFKYIKMLICKTYPLKIFATFELIVRFIRFGYI